MNYAFLSGIFLIMSIFTFGVKMYRNPADQNSFFAYRSHFSRKNEDTWYTANIYAGRALMVFAVVFLLLLILMESFVKDQVLILKVIGLYFLLACGMIYILTERRLKKIFFRDGKRRPGSY